MKARPLVLAALTIGALAACTPEAEEPELTVYAAASLAAPMTDLLDAYAADHPEISVAPPIFDGSATLVTQIRAGATPDVIATANEPTMADLTDAGLTKDPAIFATNTLVIAVPEGNPRGIVSLADLTGVDVVTCAPKVPCGSAAAELLTRAGVDLEPVSQEQSVTAAVERVVSGQVDAALVYATDVQTRETALDAVVPAGAGNVTNSYPIAALAGSGTGADFVAFVRSADGARVLSEYGFGSP